MGGQTLGIGVSGILCVRLALLLRERCERGETKRLRLGVRVGLANDLLELIDQIFGQTVDSANLFNRERIDLSFGSVDHEDRALHREGERAFACPAGHTAREERLHTFDPDPLSMMRQHRDAAVGQIRVFRSPLGKGSQHLLNNVLPEEMPEMASGLNVVRFDRRCRGDNVLGHANIIA